jgi:predicted ATPase
LLSWLLALTEQQSVLFVVADLHWIDPSTLEFLTLLVEQGPTARLLTLLTCRPEFQAPWGWRTHLTPMMLQRLSQPQVEAMSAQVTGGKVLPPDVLHHVVTKTDGVPLFVEELTKTVLESGLLRETQGHYELTGRLPPLAIPATLHDSLMARLDRLATVKAVAQLGAVLGRTFSYEVLQAVSPLDAAALQQALARLVEAKLLYQQGIPPQTTYVFKHALIQEAAYQSLLKSTRQQYHQRIAQGLEARFPDLVDTQPELLAQHYTEAGQSTRAIAHWQWAGEHALQRSANLEALSHLRRGLEVLATLPETDARTQQELSLQITLGAALTAARGYAASEVETAYTRAYELGQHLGDTPQLLPVLWGLWFFAMGRAEYGRAQALGQYLWQVGQHVQDSTVLMAGHTALGTTLLFQGALAEAHLPMERAVSLYHPQQHRTIAVVYGMDYGMVGRAWLGWQRLVQGDPSQGLQHSEEALRLAQEVAPPYNLSTILADIIVAQVLRRESQRTQEQAEALIALATEQGFTLRVAHGELFHGWALVMQGATDGGLAQMRQALAAIRTLGAALGKSWFLGLFAEACAYAGQREEGLHALEEALAHMDRTGEHVWEAELHRLKGELLGRHTARQAPEAETCFQQALVVARGQGAKWLELRAVMSLARLWQSQGKRQEAYDLLAPIYSWFTGGFDTADLQEAKALLEALA